MGIDFRRPRHIRGFKLGEVLIFDPGKALVEKTVSGAIATFADGADGVPLKKCEITLPASLDGYSEVDVVATGKNLLDFSVFSDYSNWKTDITENQSYPTANANRGLPLDLPQGTYTVSFGIDAETYPTYLYLCKDDGNASTRLIYFTGANFSVASGTFTVDGTSKYYFRLGSTGSEANFNSQIAKIAWGQIEVGSTASTFEPYQEPTIYDVEIPNPNPNLRLTADVDDGMWNTDGTIHTSSSGSWYRAFTMAVSAKTTYDIYGLLDDLIVYLDSNKTMLSYERLSNTALSLQNERKTTPANCAYIGLTALVFDVSSVSVKKSFFVYGGSIDVISGEGESTRGLALDFSTLRSGGTSSTGAYRYMLDISGVGDYNVGSCISNLLTYHVLWNSDVGEFYNMSNTLAIFLAQDNVSDAISYLQSNSCKIVYPLASPESFSVSPIAIDSKAGTNNIWNDCGTTEATYYAYAD